MHNLVHYSDPILKKPTEYFDLDNPPVDPIDFSRELVEVMIAHDGLGLAANQIGFPYRVFAFTGNPIKVCFNPKIVNTSDDEVLLQEGCLSYPGLYLKINRPSTIRFRYTLPNKETFTEQFTGLTARIIQHEMLHLDGKSFFNDVSKLKLEMAINRSNKKFNTKYSYADLIS